MSALTTEDAQRLTGVIRSWVKQYPVVEVQQAWEGRIWIPMGYGSWGEWVDCELDGFPLPRTVQDRRRVVAELHEAGMSNRAIADAIGVGPATVDRDVIATASNEAVNDRVVTGKDGRKTNVSNIGRKRQEQCSAEDLANEVIENSSAVQAARERHKVSGHVVHAMKLTTYDPQQITNVYQGHELDSLMSHVTFLRNWCNTMIATTGVAPHHLRVVTA